ncbi:MAG: alpha/beta hydrolase, partial [Chitinophagaceae bacterium]
KVRDTASELVDGGIALLAKQQSQDCRINVHLLAHSTGAFVVREAFSYADDANKIHSTAWMVSQLCFISGDVSSSSMADDSAVGASIYEHCIRFTNYHNPYDVALALSNVKRAGFGNRVGRIGLPALVPPSAVDVDCGSYFKSICDRSKDPFYSHSWYFTDDLFMYDLFHTIGGLTDRAYMDSRTVKDGELVLTALPSPMPLVTSPANV